VAHTIRFRLTTKYLGLWITFNCMIHEFVDWVGLEQQKWTHIQLGGNYDIVFFS